MRYFIIIKNFILKKIKHTLKKFLSDYQYYYLTLKRFDNRNPNLKNPRSFNEKLIYLMLNDRRDIYTHYADKVMAKELVAKKIGSKYITKTLKIWNSSQLITLNSLPKSFVLKTNHSSGDLLIIDKSKGLIDLKKIQKHFKKALELNRYCISREWSYKNIVPKIFAEELLTSYLDDEIIDYKFFCFNGKPEFMQVDTERFVNHKRNFYNLSWEELPYQFVYPRSMKKLKKPNKLDEMIWISEKLSLPFSFARVDLYYLRNCDQENIKFGEITFYPEGGIQRFSPDYLNSYLGKKINISDLGD